MKLAAIFTATSALALAASATPVPDLAKRVSPLISEFTLFSTANNCAAADAIGTFSFYKGYDSDECHSVQDLLGDASAPVFGVSEFSGDKKCQLTVFERLDCSDAGIPIGITPEPQPGCFSDAAGIQAYKIQCPWWN